MKVRLARSAESELKEAFEWYEDRQPGLGLRFLDDVAAGRRRIEEMPAAWQPIGRGVRRYRLRDFPYGLVYVAEENEIVVVTIAHLRRRTAYWKARLAIYRKGED